MLATDLDAAKLIANNAGVLDAKEAAGREMNRERKKRFGWQKGKRNSRSGGSRRTGFV